MKEHYNINGVEFNGYDWLHGPCPTNKELCGPAFVQLMQRLYEQWVRFVDSALPGIRNYINPPEFYKYIYHTKDDGSYYFTYESIGSNPQIYDDPNNPKLKHSPIDGTKFDAQYLYDVRYILLLVGGWLWDSKKLITLPNYDANLQMYLATNLSDYLVSRFYRVDKPLRYKYLVSFEDLYSSTNIKSPNGLDKKSQRGYMYFARSEYGNPNEVENSKLLDIDYAEIAKFLDILKSSTPLPNYEDFSFPALLRSYDYAHGDSPSCEDSPISEDVEISLNTSNTFIDSYFLGNIGCYKLTLFSDSDVDVAQGSVSELSSDGSISEVIKNKISFQLWSSKTYKITAPALNPADFSFTSSSYFLLTLEDILHRSLGWLKLYENIVLENSAINFYFLNQDHNGVLSISFLVTFIDDQGHEIQGEIHKNSFDSVLSFSLKEAFESSGETMNNYDYLKVKSFRLFIHSWSYIEEHLNAGESKEVEIASSLKGTLQRFTLTL